jgi:DNA-binding protein HU-beta
MRPGMKGESSMAKAAKAGAARKPATAKKSVAPAQQAKTPAPASAKPAKATGAAAKAPAAAAISLKQLAAGLAESHAMPKRQVEAMLGEFVQTFAEHLTKGTKVRINGLGIFQVRTRAARLGRNPATGEQIQIKASKKIAFRPAKELKEAI